MELSEIIRSNMKTLSILIDVNIIPDTVKYDLEIYDHFKNLKGEKVMERYRKTARAKNVSPVKVRKVVAKMRSKID